MDSNAVTSMEEATPLGPLGRKKRIPKACESCRRSKLKCDQQRPCTRCSQYHTECVYVEAVRDPIAERFEQLESQIFYLRQQVQSLQPTQSQNQWQTIQDSSTSMPTTSLGTSIPSVASLDWAESTRVAATDQATTNMGSGCKRKWHDFEMNDPDSSSFVSMGLISQADAQAWFASFFEGCDSFVPCFTTTLDTYESIWSRSSLLFDTIVTFGLRAAHGSLSPNFQHLHALLRERIYNLLFEPLTSKTGGVEAIQALLVHACYADEGGLLVSLAVRFALNLLLPDSLEDLLRCIMSRKAGVIQDISDEEEQHFRLMRVWFTVFNLDTIYSLDGGKTPSVIFKTSPRRLRMLCNHPLCTPTDLRLFAQVELNVMRVSIYASLSSSGSLVELDVMERAVASAVQGATIDLDLWLEEWSALSIKQYSPQQHENIHTLNMRVQHAYALLTIHLRALSVGSIENIAAMTFSQQGLAQAAQQAAVKHLKLILTRSHHSPQDDQSLMIDRPYLAKFRYAMRFVWAKCAFSVLLVLRLGVLLKEPRQTMLEHISDARELLTELQKAGGSEVRYTHILASSIEKCERAVHGQEMQDQQTPGHRQSSTTQSATDMTEMNMHDTASLRSIGESTAAQQDLSPLETYVPQELRFEWAFPGLNLYYLPLDWQELFTEFGAVF